MNSLATFRHLGPSTSIPLFLSKKAGAKEAPKRAPLGVKGERHLASKASATWRQKRAPLGAKSERQARCGAHSTFENLCVASERMWLKTMVRALAEIRACAKLCTIANEVDL
eukprot:3930073-Pleurochrysis_carterae.AAC.3